jgi:hypothetical protein
MHPRTEDLLTLRDGDPADAKKLARLRAAPGTAQGVARLERVRDALRGLPELDPPAEGWALVEARLAQGEPVAARRVARGAVASRAFGCAAVLAVAVIAAWFATAGLPPADAPELRADSRDGRGGEAETLDAPADGARTLGDSLRTADTGLEPLLDLPSGGGDRSVETLRAESEALERMLGTISFQRAAMSGATASAIVGLEDRIASIDAVMVTSELPPASQTSLMNVRVNLLEALVQVRLAQARPMPF